MKIKILMYLVLTFICVVVGIFIEDLFDSNPVIAFFGYLISIAMATLLLSFEIEEQRDIEQLESMYRKQSDFTARLVKTIDQLNQRAVRLVKTIDQLNQRAEQAEQQLETVKQERDALKLALTDIAYCMNSKRIRLSECNAQVNTLSDFALKAIESNGDWLSEHNTEQQIKGIESAIANAPSKEKYSLPLVDVTELYDYCEQLRKGGE